LIRDFARDGQVTGTYDDAELTKARERSRHRAD
jgi:hypothetical protein